MEDPTPAYLYSQAVNEYLGTLTEEEMSWGAVGISPQSGIHLADQLISCGNYFTCYACAETARLLDVRGADLPARRARYAKCFGGAKKSSSTLRLSGLHGSSSADMRRIRKNFYEGWSFPPGGKRVRAALVATKASSDAACSAAAERMLDELDLYVSLRDGSSDVLPLSQHDTSPDARTLWCYRTLLPIWVLTQSAYASAGTMGLPLNIYNLGFWSSEQTGGSGEPIVLELVDRLCAYFRLDPLVREGEVEEFSRRTQLAYDLCANLADEAECFRERTSSQNLPTVRNLLRARVRGNLRIPRWAIARARLIELVAVASFVGLGAALRGDEEVATGSRLGEVGETMSHARLGRGSGTVPLALIDGASGATWRTVTVDLGQDAKDGPIALFGSVYAQGHWPRWHSRAKELLGRFFSASYHLDESNPKSLLSRLCGVAETYGIERKRLGRFLALEEVASGRMDIYACLRAILEEELRACLLMMFDSAAHIPQLVRGALDGGDSATLIGAMRRTAQRFNGLLLEAWNKQHNGARPTANGMAYPPSLKTSLFEDLRKEVLAYFGEQRCKLTHETVSAKEARTQLFDLIGELEIEYGRDHGQDPSAHFLVALIKGRLYERLITSHSAPIRLDEVEGAMGEAFDSYVKAERDRFLPFSAPDISRRHALLYLENGSLFLADCGSTHGTALVRATLPGGARVLEGSQRTSLARIMGSSWVGEDAEIVAHSDVYRGDVVRMAGASAVRVG